MRTIESRRFVAGSAELRIFLIEEVGSSLPFRLRLKHSERGEVKAGGVLAGFKTEAEAQAALEVQVEKATAAGWTHVPGQVRLALEIPAAPGSGPPPSAPGCAHESIQAYLPKLAPGKSIVCPDCAENVKA
jgi:hypothetical protein